MMKPSQSSSILREVLLPTFLFLTFIIFVLMFFNTDLYCILYRQYNDDYPTDYTVSAPEKTIEKLPFAIEEGVEKCDIFKGNWVHDESWPLYEESECPYNQPEVTCLEHGRIDKDFSHWRWQPHGCSLHSFNATFMLENLRGKTMMFVGDSLNRNQFFSMICLLQKFIPTQAKSIKHYEKLKTVFTAKEYNASIEFYWAPFLLESNADNIFRHHLKDKIVRNGSIDKHGQHWKEADIIVFNTYTWWISGFRLLRGSFDDQVKDIVEIPTDEAYRFALKSLVKWIEENVDPKKKRILFTSMSPSHQSISNGHGDQIGNCYNVTTMLRKPTYVESDKRLMQISLEEFSKSVFPITFLNITELSSFRKDAHASINRKIWTPLTPKQKANPESYADCIHWCLPGVPDTWNELLYSKLFYP